MFSCSGVELNATVNFIENDFDEAGQLLAMMESNDTSLEQITIDELLPS